MAITTTSKKLLTTRSASTSVTGAGAPPVIGLVQVTDSSYNVLDDTAIGTEGGYLKITGSNFKTDCVVYINGVSVTTTRISNTEVRVASPSVISGTYSIILFNTDSAGAIYLNLTASPFPVFTTAAGNLGSVYETNASNVTIAATSDSAVTYAVTSGSLPPGVTLDFNTGLLSGTTALTGTNTTYSFVISATDAQLQNSSRSFSLTVNTDIVTWSSPADSSTITITQDISTTQTLVATSAAGKSITYTANQLPAGLTISGATVAGTPITAGTSTTIFTATAATTGRMATRAINWTINPGVDQYFAYVPLLLKTAPSSTRSTTTPDSSANNLTVTKTGAPSTGWASPYQTDGYWSNYFTGSSTTGNLALTQAASNLIFPSVNAGAFTIEFWIFITPAGTTFNSVVLSGWSGSVGQVWWEIICQNTGFFINLGNNGFGNSSGFLSSSTPFVANQWTHVVLQRRANGTNWDIFQNGVNTAANVTSGNSFNLYTPAPIRIGRGYTNSTASVLSPFYLSNLRIVNNSAIYPTTGFTPPTTPLTAVSGTALLTCQSNRFIDNSANNFTLTATNAPKVSSDWYPSGFTGFTASLGAAYFNGTTDYFSTTSITPPGTGSVTYECWFYITSLPNGTVMNSRSGNTADGIDMVVTPSGKLAATYTGTGLYTGGNFTIAVNTWYHLAFVRNGSSNWTVYVNGQQDGTFTSAVNITSTTFSVGFTLTGTSYFPGYISNVRVTNLAVYTGNFTPPTNFLTQTGGTYPSTANVNTSIIASNTKLLLNFAESNYTSAQNSVQNNTFIDSSNYAFPITRNGTPTQGSVTPYRPNGYWSNYFNGTSNLTAPNNAAFNFGTGDFTIEFWIYCTVAWTSMNNPGIAGQKLNDSTGGWQIYRNGTNNTDRMNIRISATNDYPATSGPATNTWEHWAVVRSGTTLTWYKNGTTAGSYTGVSANISDTGAFYLGYTQTWGGYFTGYISNLRVVKGTAIVPPAGGPTSPLTAVTNTQLLICQSNRFKDNSTNNFTITLNGTPIVQQFQPFNLPTAYTPATYGGSGYFNGSTDYLTISAPNGGPLDISGGSNFTIELWFYATSTGINTLYARGGTNGTQNAQYWATLNNGGLQWGVGNGGTGAAINNLTNVRYNCWNHFAVALVGTTLTAYLNGAVGNTATLTFTIPTTISNPSLWVGATVDPSARYHFSGYIAGFRLVKGTALYTAAFTPPTAPVTAIANTSALLNFANSGVYDAAGQNNLITVGDAQASTAAAQWSPTSMRFDATGDYLNFISNPALSFGTADNFTIEAWVRVGTFADSFIISGTGGGGFFGFTGTTLIGIGRAGTAWDYTATHGMSGNTWYHVAVTRTSGLVRLYVNGNQVGTTSGSNTNAYNFSSPSTYIGSQGAALYFNGFIQDLRITRASRSSGTTITLPVATFVSR